MLVLLDHSAAFDTIDKHIPIERLKSHFGVQCIALKWLTSYMSDRFMSVAVDIVQILSLSILEHHKGLLLGRYYSRCILHR